MYKTKKFQIISSINNVQKKYFSVPVNILIIVRNYKTLSMDSSLIQILLTTMR